MRTACPQCGVKVGNVARHIAHSPNHQRNYGTILEPSTPHDYTDFDVERMHLDFDDTWNHYPDQDNMSLQINPNNASQASLPHSPGKPNDDGPQDAEFVGAGLLISQYTMSNR